MTANLRVRVATSRDANVVEKVLLESYPALMAGAYDEELLDRALSMMTRPNMTLLSSGAYYLAEVENEPVGCGGWTLEEPGSGKVVSGIGHIRHFGVTARWAGRGVGRALYAHCEEAAREAGIERFLCFASLNGEAFYAALGFTASGSIGVPIGPAVTFPSILMQRPI